MKWIEQLHRGKPFPDFLGRKLSSREKILCILLLGLLVEFLIYYWIYQPMQSEIANLSAQERTPIVEKKTNYVGMLNFSKEQMPGLLKYAPISDPTFQISYEENQKILNMNFGVDASHLENLDDLTRWFGYSRFDLHRLENGNFLVSMQAEKPMEDVYYDDIRVSYLQDSSKLPEKIPPIVKEPTGPAYSPAPILPPSHRKNKISKDAEQQKVEKEKQKIEEDVIPKASSTPDSNQRDKWEEATKLERKVKIATEEVPVNDLDLSKISTTGYHSSYQWKENTKTLYIYFKSHGEDELKIIFPQAIKKGNFELFLPQNILGEFILLCADGNTFSYPEQIEGGNWTKISIDQVVPVTAIIYRSPKEVEEENILSMRSFVYEE